MKKGNRKHIRLLAMAMSLVVVGMLAAFIALAAQPEPAAAQQDLCDGPLAPLLRAVQRQHETPGTTPTPPTDVTPTPGTDPVNGDGTMSPMSADLGGETGSVESSSTSGSATVEIELQITDLRMPVPVGGSIVLYLEDDFEEPDSISASDVYFVSRPRKLVTGYSSRVYATVNPEMDSDGYFTADKSDISIRVLVPDMCTNATDACEGDNGLIAGDDVTVVIQKSAGIKNPSEEGDHSTGYDVLDSTGDVSSGMDDPDTDAVEGFVVTTVLPTYAKISLSDVDNSRGYELTVIGSGFNDGTTATAWVLGRQVTTAEWWNALDCDDMNALVDPNDAVTDAAMGTSPCTMYDGLDATAGGHKSIVDAADTTKGYAEKGVCQVIIDKGTAAGSGLVGSDDKVAVSFEVTVPTFNAGKHNYICMNDGEDRRSETDVEDFELESSIEVVPSTVSSGDTVNVFARDFPFSGQALTQVKLAGVDVTDSVKNLTRDGLVNGSATISFEVPGSVGGAPLQGTVRLDARWGTPGSDDKCNVDADSMCTSENTKLTVTGSELTASVTDVLPNETITITGNGFGSQTCIGVTNIQLDGVRIQVDDESTISDCDHDDDGTTKDIVGVEVSNSGQFVATITLWPYDTRASADNPTLISGSHTLDVEDSSGFIGSTKLAIAKPTIAIVPEVVGPRDYVVITGTNWPIDNTDNSNVGLVEVEIADDRNARTYSVYPDNTGRFTIDHRVSKDVAIPSTNQVKGAYRDVVEVGSFAVPAATVTVTPNQAQPGDIVSLSATDMKPYAEADYVKIGGTSYNDPGANTDIDGNITIEDVLVPGLDPGTYSVIIDVDGTVAIGELEVLAEGPTGQSATLPEAVETVGDELVRMFYFNGVDKTWSFFDPRPEFAGLNTLTSIINGQPYWILVSEEVENVVLNNKTRNLTCVGGDCWNQLVW